MKVQITRSNNAPTGYELVTTNDDGTQTVQLIEKTYPNEPFTLVLPTNASNRKYFNSKKVENAGGTIELEYKESKPIGTKTEPTTRKGLEEYLEGDDKILYLQLVEKAKDNREKAKAPMTDYEKALRQVEKWQKKVEELSKGGKN